MQYRKLTELKELPGNPRKIDDKQFDILCQSIEQNKDYFEARPLILSDRTGELVILGGNQRYKAAKKLKLKEVPTYLLKGLTEEREKEIIIRDNVNNGAWDYAELENSWDSGLLADWGLSLPNYSAGVDVNDMDEEDLDITEEFDPVGEASGLQKVVFIFDGEIDAKKWIEQTFDDNIRCFIKWINANRFLITVSYKKLQ